MNYKFLSKRAILSFALTSLTLSAPLIASDDNVDPLKGYMNIMTNDSIETTITQATGALDGYFNVLNQTSTTDDNDNNESEGKQTITNGDSTDEFAEMKELLKREIERTEKCVKDEQGQDFNFLIFGKASFHCEGCIPNEQTVKYLEQAMNSKYLDENLKCLAAFYLLQMHGQKRTSLTKDERLSIIKQVLSYKCSRDEGGEIEMEVAIAQIAIRNLLKEIYNRI